MHNPFLNDINRPTRNPPKRNRRGGACVPARTSAQRRFHTKNMRIVCGDFNDGCAPAGRHGRAHRHRPYQSPSYFSTQSHTNKITIYAQSHTNEINRLRVILPNDIIHPNETRKQSTHTSGAEMHRALPPPFFKTNCVYANWHRDDAHLF